MKTTKITQIISIVLMVIPSLMLVMSGVMKLIGAPEVVDGLTKGGLGNYIILFGLIELLAVALLWIPKTRNIGFFLICSYLGGALSIELAHAQVPAAAVLLTLLWISLFLHNKKLFIKGSEPKNA
ncbi:MAG: DoxX family protein [Flavobacteriia bacterium]|jgi:sorbitol-specific phosphotransferase system component IIC